MAETGPHDLGEEAEPSPQLPVRSQMTLPELAATLVAPWRGDGEFVRCLPEQVPGR
jgi:hypothetical protein